MRKVPQSEKDRKKKEIRDEFKLGKSGAPLSPSSVSSIPSCEPISSSVYGHLIDDLDLSIEDPDFLGHQETVEDFSIWGADLNRKKETHDPKADMSLKELASFLMEKEDRKNRPKAPSVNEKAKAAKQAALKARRREFASQKARLILIMIEDGQDYICAHCKSEENLTVDHVFPLSRGGTDDPSNLVFLCQSCNSIKGITIINDISDMGRLGCAGVNYRKDTGKWRSQIKIDGETINLGTFVDEFEAICARKSAENKHKREE